MLFETGSALRRIESRVFARCDCLSSVMLAGAIETLSSDWYEGSSIGTVTFKSADCVRGLIERGAFEIGRGLEIQVRLGEDESEADLKWADGRIVFVRGECNELLNEGATGSAS
jgi:hypothetical protein